MMWAENLVELTGGSRCSSDRWIEMKRGNVGETYCKRRPSSLLGSGNERQ